MSGWQRTMLIALVVCGGCSTSSPLGTGDAAVDGGEVMCAEAIALGCHERLFWDDYEPAGDACTGEAVAGRLVHLAPMALVAPERGTYRVRVTPAGRAGDHTSLQVEQGRCVERGASPTLCATGPRFMDVVVDRIDEPLYVHVSATVSYPDVDNRIEICVEQLR